MAFFPAHEMHEIHLKRADGRERALTSLLVLGAHGLLAMLLLLGLMRQVVTPPLPPPLVMTDLYRNPTPLVSVAPPAPLQVHVAPMMVQAPDISIQPDVTQVREPSAAPALVTSPATSTLASAMVMASSGATVSAGASPGASSGGGAGGYDINPYLARVALQIKANLHSLYRPLVDMPEEIRVSVHLIFRRDGTVEKAEVYKSSGYLPYDHEAVAAVLRAQPLPPFPPELKGERINGIIPVVFDPPHGRF